MLKCVTKQKKSCLSLTAMVMRSLHLLKCLSPSLIPALYIEFGNSPMQNTTHLHRQASYQSQFPCLPTMLARFGGVKSQFPCFGGVNHSFHALGVSITVSMLWGCQSQFPCLLALGVSNRLTDSLHASLILRSQSSSAWEKVVSAWWLHPHIHNLHAWYIGMTAQARNHLIRGGRFPDSSCAPPTVVIAHRATRGRPLLLGNPPERDDRSFVLRWTLIHWAAICIWTTGHVGVCR